MAKFATRMGDGFRAEMAEARSAGRWRRASATRPAGQDRAAGRRHLRYLLEMFERLTAPWGWSRATR